jgi:hypothetical protein
VSKYIFWALLSVLAIPFAFVLNLVVVSILSFVERRHVMAKPMTRIATMVWSAVSLFDSFVLYCARWLSP